MKKLIAAALIAALAVLTWSCGGVDGTSGQLLGRTDDAKTAEAKTQASPLTEGAHGVSDAGPVSFQAILMYVETGNTEYFQPRILNAAQQAALRAEIEKEGGSVTFDADGTINITGSGSSRLTLRPDGSVEGVDEDGKSFGFKNNKEWPDSEFAKAVPKADFDIKMQTGDEESLMILFENVTLDEAKAYGKKLAEAGFTVDSQEIDLPDNGMYGYSGKNADGIEAEFNYVGAAGEVTCALSVGRFSENGPVTDDPYFPPSGNEADLPEKFAFLLPEGKGDYSVLDNGGFISVERSGASVDEARGFTARAAAAGFEIRTEQNNVNPAGSDSYFAVLTKGNAEIHVSFNLTDPGRLAVDVIETADPDPQLPAGTDPWPLTGPLTRIPKPDFGTGFTIRDDGDSISAAVSGASEADFPHYMQMLKDAGFTLKAEYENEGGVSFYYARNSEAYSAYVQNAYGVFVIGVSVEPEE